MRLPGNIKNFQTEGAGGGVNMATGLPFAPNVQQYSPEHSTSTVAPTKEYLQGIDRGQQAYADQIGGMQDEQKLAAQAARGEVNIRQGYAPDAFEREDPFEAKRQIGQAAKDEQYWQERQQLRQDKNLRVQQAHAQYDERFRSAVEAQNTKGFWDDKTAEQKSMARLWIWIGAIGAGISGEDNKALAYVNNQVKLDAEKKAQRAQRLMQLAEQSRGALSDAYRQRAEELSDFDLNYAAGMKILADQAALYAKTMLPQTLQAQAQQKVAAVKQEAAKAYQDAHEKLNARVENKDAHTTTTMGLGNGGQPPQFDKTLAIYGDAMDSALDEMDKLPRPSQDELQKFQDNATMMDSAAESSKTIGGAFKTVAGRKLGLLPRNIGEDVSPEAQKFYNAMARANEGFQRVVSGANLQEKERQRLLDQLAFQPGDTPEVLDWKMAGMKRERDNFLGLAGAARQLLPSAQEKAATIKPAAKQKQAPKAPPELVERAKAALKANPNNAKAKKVLELAGVSP